jgi:flagellar motility protein MotE (MotC chaperone)
MTRQFSIGACCLAAVLAFTAGAVHAQRMFKYVMPDGRVVYSDKSVPGGRLVDEIAPAPPPDPAAAQPRQDTRTEQRDALRERLADRESQFQRASADLNEARGRLAAAERQLADGKEPLPGERTGNVGGGSRLNELYWQRQAANEAAVAQARTEVQQAEAAVNQLR